MPFAFSVPISSALPSWTATIGGVQQADVGYNAFSTGAPEVSLIGPGGPALAIDGSYSVLLTGSFSAAYPSISQTGLIPAGIQSLFFAAQKGFGAGGNGNLSVLIGSQSVPITTVAVEPNYTLYGANISAWAGSTEELTFSALPTTSGLNNWTLDDISFSTTAVPEPNPLILMGSTGLLFAARRRYIKRP